MKRLYLFVLCLLFGQSHGRPFEAEVIKTEGDPQDDRPPNTLSPSHNLVFVEATSTLQPEVIISGEGAGGSLGGGFGGVQRSTGLWKPFNGRSFLFVSDYVSWAQAQQNCLALGGNLATVHNKPEDEFVQSIAEGRKAWIGFSDAQEDRYWFWINSDPLSYTNWCPGQPDNYLGNQKCGTTNYDGRGCWDDTACSKKFPFICERKEEMI